MHTGNLLTQLLGDYGVKVVFGVPGGQTVALFDGIEQQERLRHIICRDERNVAYMADAYARVTGTIGVCDVTVGPGTTKLPSGLMEAHCSSYPILCLISELFLDWRHLYERGAALQAMDQESLVRQFCKWTVTVTDPGQLPMFLATALRRANSARPGPVALVLPQEVFDQQLPDSPRSSPPDAALASFPIARCAPDGEAIERASAILAGASRPVIVGGGGIHISGAYDQLQRLAERLGAPVATTFSGRGALEDDHELAVGLVGNMGTTAAKCAVEQADVVLLVGYKSGQNSTCNWTLPRAGQTVIHLDIDGTEIGKVFTTEVGLVGDARLGLAALADALTATPADLEARIERVRRLRAQWRQEIAANLSSDAVPIMPQRVMHELNQLTGPDDILCCDASYVSAWGAMFYHVRRRGKMILAPRGSAGLGYGIPAAIGAAVALPGRRCIAICGDHGVSYSLGELATAVHYKLNITVIVFNNQGARWIDHYHQVFFAGSGQPFVWGDTDFAMVGQGFGCLGIGVTQPQQLADALRQALEHDGPAIVDVRTCGKETPIQAYREAMSTNKPVE